MTAVLVSTTSVGPDARQRALLSRTILAVAIVFVFAEGYYLTRQQITVEQAAARGNLLKTVVDDIESGIVVVDMDRLTIADWSRGAQKLTGWSRADVVGKPLNYLLPPSAWAGHEAYLTDPQLRRTLVNNPITVNCWAITKSHEYLPIHVQLSATKTQPAKLLVTIDHVDKVRQLPSEPLPKASPAAMPTFSPDKLPNASSR